MPKTNEIRMIAINSNGKVFFNTVKDGVSDKTEMSQAIQIPKKHGDIKDIDTFLKDKSLTEYIENDVFNKKYTYTIGTGAIYNAPTILEAEE